MAHTTTTAMITLEVDPAQTGEHATDDRGRLPGNEEAHQGAGLGKDHEPDHHAGGYPPEMQQPARHTALIGRARQEGLVDEGDPGG